MKILLTGATGYIGRRLLPSLLELGHEVVCCLRDKSRFNLEEYQNRKLSVIEIGLLDPGTLQTIPIDIEAAYYLVHSMSTAGDFSSMESSSAANFRDAISKTAARQVIYLSGIVNETVLSKHLESRLEVERILAEGS